MPLVKIRRTWGIRQATGALSREALHPEITHQLLQPNLLEFIRAVVSLVNDTDAFQLFDSIKVIIRYGTHIH